MSTSSAEQKKDRRPHTLLPAAVMTYGTNVATSVLSLTQVLIVARTLGPAGRGQVALMITISMVTSQIASLGIQEANANIGGAEPQARPRLATNSLLATLILSALGAVVVLVLVIAVPSAGGQIKLWLLGASLAGIPLLMLRLYLSFLLQSDYRFGVTNLAWLAGPVTTVTTNGLFAILGILTVETAIFMWILGQVLCVLLLIVHVHRHIGFGRPDHKLGLRSLSFGLKTHVGRFMAMGTYRIDQWLVGALAGPRELGLYSIAVAWSETLMYVPGVVVLLQRPDLVRADPRHAAERAAQICRRVVLLSTGAGAVLLAAAPILCVTVFGAKFRDSVIDLRILALSAPGVVLLELLSNAVIAQRRPLRASIAEAVALVVTLVACALLIPSLGGRGAAIATSAAYSAGGIVMAAVFVRTLRGSASDLVPQVSDLGWYYRKGRALLGLTFARERPVQ